MSTTEAPSTSTPNDSENRDARGRRYEVSELVPLMDPPAWRPVSTEVCSSARQAVRDYVLRVGATTGQYRAIPVRNITQVRAAVETSTQLTFS